MRLICFLLIAALYAKMLWDTEVNLLKLQRGLPWMADFIVRMFPPDFSVLSSALKGALQTLEIAVVGTTLAALLALPLGFLSARNIAPPGVFYGVRGILNLFRSIDTMVYALFFVAAVGLGPFPGVMAVVVYTAMSLAKLYSEAIEGIDTGPVEAITATGATRLRDPAIWCHSSDHPAVHLIYSLSLGDQYPCRRDPGVRRGWRHWVLYSDLPAHDELSGCCLCPPDVDHHGHGGGFCQLTNPQSTCISPH